MRVFSFAGPHGIGKTTLIKSLNLGEVPVARYTNFDLSPYDGAEGQIDRIGKYFAVLRSAAELERTDFVVLLDRSPYDFYPYAEYRGVLDKVEPKIKELIDAYESLNPMTVILVEPYDYIELNIMKRRREYAKEELDMLADIYDKFYSFEFVGRIKGDFIRVRSDDVIRIISEVLD